VPPIAAGILQGSEATGDGEGEAAGDGDADAEAAALGDDDGLWVEAALVLPHAVSTNSAITAARRIARAI
jgi:hypothetical protein